MAPLTEVVHELFSDEPAAADNHDLHVDSPRLSPASRGCCRAMKWRVRWPYSSSASVTLPSVRYAADRSRAATRSGSPDRWSSGPHEFAVPVTETKAKSLLLLALLRDRHFLGVAGVHDHRQEAG